MVLLLPRVIICTFPSAAKKHVNVLRPGTYCIRYTKGTAFGIINAHLVKFSQLNYFLR
jgi:hypothetical protein